MDDRWPKVLLAGGAGVFLILVLGYAVSVSGEGGELEGRTWSAETVAVGSMTEAPIPGTAMTARFADSSIEGSAGCNNYFGSYLADGSSIAIGPLASTRKFCPEPAGVMDQEIAFLAALERTDSFELTNDTLVLLADGSPVVRFTSED